MIFLNWTSKRFSFQPSTRMMPNLPTVTNVSMAWSWISVIPVFSTNLCLYPCLFQISRYLDFMNILSYDYHSAFEPSVNHHSPLYSIEEESEYNFDSQLTIVSELRLKVASSSTATSFMTLLMRNVLIFTGCHSETLHFEGGRTRETSPRYPNIWEIVYTFQRRLDRFGCPIWRPRRTRRCHEGERIPSVLRGETNTWYALQQFWNS